MDFAWTENQLARRAAAVDFAQRELGADVADRDARGAFSRDDWDKCARFGIQGMAVPERYGGLGEDLLTHLLVMEGLGFACRDNGLLLALNGQFVGPTRTLLDSANEEQKQTYLRAICSGERIGASSRQSFVRAKWRQPGRLPSARASSRTDSSARGGRCGGSTMTKGTPAAAIAAPKARARLAA